ncbi:hypothetical protein THRCLA_22816 [Thraustotheca clavata]|uniref:RBR-type E3 ubiquitin transferase n=1 Tax=Thraustotheca clavata TaxID=74557 RepID=A0A1V9YSZ7_9STRA|nr:hypothetical protein THRCLA_22816 [Thraustotheca clavata]
MGALNSAPQYRSETERQQLQAKYIVFVATLYILTFWVAYPGFELVLVKLNALTIAAILRVISTLLHAIYLFLGLPFAICVLLDKEGYFYVKPSPGRLFNRTWRHCLENECLWILPWLPLTPIAFIVALVVSCCIKKNDKQKKEPSAALTKTSQETKLSDHHLDVCIICLEHVKSSMLAKFCSRCSTICCQPCLSKYIKLIVAQEHVAPNQLVCMGCQLPLDINFVASQLDAKQKVKYRNALIAIDSKHPCPSCIATLPTNSSSWLQRRIQCKQCKKSWCRECHKPYHILATCIDKSFLKWCKSNDVDECPSCKRWIQRTSKCTRATCPKCFTNFKWSK